MDGESSVWFFTVQIFRCHVHASYCLKATVFNNITGSSSQLKYKWNSLKTFYTVSAKFPLAFSYLSVFPSTSTMNAQKEFLAKKLSIYKNKKNKNKCDYCNCTDFLWVFFCIPSTRAWREGNIKNNIISWYMQQLFPF